MAKNLKFYSPQVTEEEVTEEVLLSCAMAKNSNFYSPQVTEDDVTEDVFFSPDLIGEENPIDEDFGDHNQLDSICSEEMCPLRKSFSMNDVAALRDSPDIKGEEEDPIDQAFGDHNQLDSICSEDKHPLRKSLSMNDVAALREDFVTLSIKNTRESPNGLVKNKYVSMADAHSFRPATFRPQPSMQRFKLRSRPLHILSRKEKEQMEFEEIRKIKIKARPIPKFVKEGSHKLPEVQRKPNTVTQPFKLTEPKKPASPKPEVIFKARPAPRHISEKAHIPSKPPVQVTKPITPKFLCKQRATKDGLNGRRKSEEKGIKHLSVPYTASKHERTGPLKPIPFSFEKRDELIKKRKEERIKQIIANERKQASQFKAQPLPAGIKKQMRNAVPKAATATASSENKENKNE